MSVRCNRKGDCKLQLDGEGVYVCMIPDFLLGEADGWCAKAWDIIRRCSDLNLVITTKCIHRFEVGLPGSWRSGYENVTICCTCENQNRADYRLSVFLELPIRHRAVTHESMLEQINIRKYLVTGKIEGATCGGGPGSDARVCNFAQILDSMEQCVKYDVSFQFKQTGAKFKKGNKVYLIDRKTQMSQVQKAGINYKC